jgi:hypothetical protein
MLLNTGTPRAKPERRITSRRFKRLRLFENQKGFISDPVGRAKSVVLTDEGQERAERLFRDLFETKA